MNYCVTSMGESDNVVHHMNTFIASSLAFGCHVGFHRLIFVVGLLFLNTAVVGKDSIRTSSPLLGFRGDRDMFLVSISGIQASVAQNRSIDIKQYPAQHGEGTL